MNNLTKAKLNIKTIVGNISKVVEMMEEGEVLRLCSLIGKVSAVKNGLDVFGDSSLFIGEFEAVDYRSDITYRSGKCFLPEPLQSLVLIELKKGLDVQFAVEIEVIKKSMFLVGYSSDINFIRLPESIDVLKRMRESVLLERKAFMNECKKDLSDCNLPFLEDGEGLDCGVDDVIFEDENKIEGVQNSSGVAVEVLEEIAIKTKVKTKKTS